MKYIQLDNFNENLNLVCEDDGSGDVKVFDSLQEAEDTLEENCQDGQVIPLDINIIQLFKDCEEFISMAIDEGFEDKELTNQLDEVLGHKVGTEAIDKQIVDSDLMNKEEEMKYVIQEMYNSHKNGTFNIVHIGDLVCKILNINATFYPSGKIEENK